MTAEQYNRWTGWLRAHPSGTRALMYLNKGITLIGYVMYPVLLAYLYLHDPGDLVRFILVPGISFVLVSLARKIWNLPRPYECLDIEPLLRKDTVGHSMPSRHTFSMFIIAMCYLKVMPVVGVICLAAGVFMGVVRILAGFHFPRDVAAGAAIGIAVGILGFWLIP